MQTEPRPGSSNTKDEKRGSEEVDPNERQDMPSQPEQQAAEDSKGPGRILYQIEESLSGKVFQAYCPELVITAFGDSAEQARESLRSQVITYLEDCDELGTLEEVLIEAGFYHNGEAWVSNEVAPVKDPNIRFYNANQIDAAG